VDTKVEGPDPLLGSTVAGRYTVTRRIARGGMGVVYQAVQEGLGRAVALKIIRKDAAADPVMQKRFEREAKAVSSLSHPCIVTVYDFGRTDDGSLFLAMELVDGDVLRDVLKRKKKLGVVESLPIVEAIASALARAHASGVVHRDLKPENVMLPRVSGTTTGAVAAKVLDFGLAKPHDENIAVVADEHLTRDGGFVGTPGYTAPEATEGAPEDPRQDLYALGVVWHEMLSGEHPFAAPTPMKVVVRQLNEVAPSLSNVPPDIAALVRSLLARNPDERPANAQALLDRIAVVKTQLLQSGAPARTPEPGPVSTSSGVQSLLASLPPEHPTVDDRGPALSLSSAPTVVAAKAPAASAPTPASTTSAASAASSLGKLALLVLLAGAVGAVVVVAMTGGFAKLFHGDDAGADAGNGTELVDNGDAAPRVLEPPRGVDIELTGVPTFTAFENLRDVLPTSGLVTYSKERAVLHLEVGDAAKLAELLQGRALQSDLPLVIEIKEMAPGRIVAVAVRPEEASALQDAGALYDGGSIADAGPVVLVPGGLTP
jgi:serine/threonine protein kinase